MTTIPSILPQASLALSKPDTNPVSTSEKSFSDYLNSTIDQVMEAQQKSDTAIEKLSTGEAKDMHQVMIAVQEADISLRMLVQVRNKALQAYNDIIGMQI